MYENAMQEQTRSGSAVYPCSTAYLPRIRCRYAGLNMDTRVSSFRSARRIHPNRVEFDLSGQHMSIPHVVHAVCECIYTNQHDRFKRGLRSAGQIRADYART